MSLDKSIQHGKDRRKPYRGRKSFSKPCRNNGDCPVCRSNRMHKVNREQERGEAQIHDLNHGEA